MPLVSIANGSGQSIAVKANVDGYAFTIVVNPAPGYGYCVFNLKHSGGSDYVWRKNLAPVVWIAGENNPRVASASERAIVKKFSAIAAEWAHKNSNVYVLQNIARSIESDLA